MAEFTIDGDQARLDGWPAPAPQDVHGHHQYAVREWERRVRAAGRTPAWRSISRVVCAGRTDLHGRWVSTTWTIHGALEPEPVKKPARKTAAA